MNLKTLALLLITAACTGQMYGYSWAIKNGTNKNLYIHLSTKFTNPIGKSNKGVLVKPGEVSDSTGISERLPKKFTELIIADDESMTKNKVNFNLNDDHNINYTITIDQTESPGKSITQYQLRSNNAKGAPDYSDDKLVIHEGLDDQGTRLREQKELIESQRIASQKQKDERIAAETKRLASEISNWNAAAETKRQEQERVTQAEEAKRLEIKRQEDLQRNIQEQKLAEQQRADAEKKRLELQRAAEEAKRQEEELAKKVEFQNNQIMPTLYRILKAPTTESKAAMDLFEKIKELEQGKNKDKAKEAISGLISQGANLNQALILAIIDAITPIKALQVSAEQSQSLQEFAEASLKISRPKFNDNIIKFLLKEYKNKIKLNDSDKIFNHTPLYIAGTFLAGNAIMLGSAQAQLGLASMLGKKKEIKELEKSSEQIRNRLYTYEKIALTLIANGAPKADFLSAIDDFAKTIDYAMGRQARMFKMQIGFDNIMNGIKGIAQGKKLPRN